MSGTIVIPDLSFREVIAHTSFKDMCMLLKKVVWNGKFVVGIPTNQNLYEFSYHCNWKKIIPYAIAALVLGIFGILAITFSILFNKKFSSTYVSFSSDVHLQDQNMHFLLGVAKWINNYAVYKTVIDQLGEYVSLHPKSIEQIALIIRELLKNIRGEDKADLLGALWNCNASLAVELFKIAGDEERLYCSDFLKRCVESGDAEHLQLLISYGADSSIPVGTRFLIEIAEEYRMVDSSKSSKMVQILKETEFGRFIAQLDAAFCWDALDMIRKSKFSSVKEILHGQLLAKIALLGDVLALKKLLKITIDPKVINYQIGRPKNTPLHLAAQNGHFQVVLELLTNGFADPSICNIHGEVARDLSEMKGFEEITKVLDKTPFGKFLMQFYTDLLEGNFERALKACYSRSFPNARRKLYGFLFLLAAGEGREQIVKKLFPMVPFDLHWQATGNTALHEAALYGHLKVVQVILEMIKKHRKGEELICMKNRAGRTAIELAQEGKEADLQESQKPSEREEISTRYEAIISSLGVVRE